MTEHVATPHAIDVGDVTKAFGKTKVLKGVGLSVALGEIVALLGPSGCGKTTLLRLLAGLERPDSGRIALGGQVVADGRRLFVAPEKRGVGLVFQDYALFPQRTVGENVAFGLRKSPRAARPSRVAEVLARVDLAGYEARYPHELSGGQQQRVALARALAPSPSVLLLDEPFSNLDAALRRRLRLELGTLLRELRITTVFVTHDQDEALSLADRVAVMAGGLIAQVGSPREVYQRPATEAVAHAVGEVNIVEGHGSAGSVDTLLGTLQGTGPDGPVRVVLRPEDLGLVDESSEGGAVAEVRAVEYLGREAHALVAIGDLTLSLRCEREAPPSVGAAVRVCVRPTCEPNWFKRDL